MDQVAGHILFQSCDVMWQVTTSSSWILKKIVRSREYVCATNYWDDVVATSSYKTDAMYKALRGYSEQVSWKRVLFNNRARPQATLIMWMALMKKLSTKERLARFGVYLGLKVLFLRQNGNHRPLVF